MRPGPGQVIVYRGALPVDGEDVARIRALVLRRGSAICNPDLRRWQLKLATSDGGRRDQGCDPLVARVVAWVAHKINDAPGWEGLEMGGIHALHSIAGCRQQPWHTDYDPSSSGSFARPVGVLVALEGGTRFVTTSEVYELDVGDVLCFDGAVVHAGAAYAVENTRLHVYLDAVGCRRKAGVIWMASVPD